MTTPIFAAAANYRSMQSERAKWLSQMTPDQKAAFDDIPDSNEYASISRKSQQNTEYQYKTDPEKLRKRSHWALSGIIPPDLRRSFPGTALAATAAVILRLLKSTGVSDKHYGYIATCAGASTKTVQRCVAIMELVGFNVARGRFDGRTNEPTRITCGLRKVLDWIGRNSGKPCGQISPAKLIIDRFFLRSRPDSGYQGVENPRPPP